MTSDSFGGATIAWEDFRSGVHYDVYAQRITARGTAAWGANGVGLCTLTGDQASPKVLSDGQGGAFVVWTDDRNVAGDPDLYMQRLTPGGGISWAISGSALAAE